MKVICISGETGWTHYRTWLFGLISEPRKDFYGPKPHDVLEVMGTLEDRDGLFYRFQEYGSVWYHSKDFLPISVRDEIEEFEMLYPQFKSKE